ncbi:MAG: hypothetical protein RSE41_01150 [Clostridia bacterium]
MAKFCKYKLTVKYINDKTDILEFSNIDSANSFAKTYIPSSLVKEVKIEDTNKNEIILNYNIFQELINKYSKK